MSGSSSSKKRQKAAEADEFNHEKAENSLRSIVGEEIANVLVKKEMYDQKPFCKAALASAEGVCKRAIGADGRRLACVRQLYAGCSTCSAGFNIISTAPRLDRLLCMPFLRVLIVHRYQPRAHIDYRLRKSNRSQHPHPQAASPWWASRNLARAREKRRKWKRSKNPSTSTLLTVQWTHRTMATVEGQRCSLLPCVFAFPPDALCCQRRAAAQVGSYDENAHVRFDGLFLVHWC